MERHRSSYTLNLLVALGALALAACSNVSPPDATIDTVDTLAESSRSGYHVAEAAFWHEDGCLTSSVDVYVTESSYRSSPGGPRRATYLGVWAALYDTCGAAGWDTRITLAGWQEISDKDFQVTGNLGRARLTSTIDLHDREADVIYPVFVDIAWSGVGDVWTWKDRHHEHQGDTKYHYRSEWSGRTAEATATIDLPDFGTPQPLLGSGWMVAQTNASTIIDGGGKRPRAPTVDSFDAYPQVIFPGGSTTLYWWVSGTDPITLDIDGGVGDVTGRTHVTVAPSETTTYTLTARNRRGSSSAEVTVHVVPPPQPDDHEPNDTSAAAAPISLDFRADLTLLPGDLDWFTFTLAEETNVQIVVGSTYPWIYPIVTLFDDALEVVAEGLSWNEVVLAAGTYVVGVTGFPDFDYQGLHSETGTYSLMISVVAPPVPDEHEPNDTAVQATPVVLPFASGELTITPGDVDWFTFTLTTGALVTVDIDAVVLGSLLDSYIGLFDEGLDLIAVNDDADFLDSWLQEHLAPGVYYLAVTGYPDGGFSGDHDRNGFYFVSLSAAP